MSICLHIIHGCFCARTAELSSRNNDYMVSKAENIYHLGLYRKQLPTVGLEYYRSSAIPSRGWALGKYLLSVY